MGSYEWRSEKRPRIAGRIIALRSLWTRAPGLLCPQQTTWHVAALLVRRRSKSDTENQTDEKRRSLELALQNARYEASRIERQYQATEPENPLVAAELEKRWNNALTHVTEMEQRLEEARVLAPNSQPSSANNCWHWAMTWNSSGTILVPR